MQGADASDFLDAPTTDPPRGEEYWVAASDEFQHAEDLVRYIRKHYGDAFCIGVAGTLVRLARGRPS